MEIELNIAMSKRDYNLIIDLLKSLAITKKNTPIIK